MKRALLLLLCCCVVPRLASAAAKWSRVDTPNFIVIGATGESQLRDVGRQFEAFREALSRVLSSAVTATPVPTVVVVFADDKTFDPFKPIYEGKKVDIGGLFVPRASVNYILIGPNHGFENLRPVFHEYSHLIVNNVAPNLPVWVNEGLAEYYSTFELDRDGRAVIFGRVIPEHYRELGSTAWMPLGTLLATDHGSPAYNENSRRGAFYAEAWMLMHMIQHGQPDRRQAFGAYLRELGAGTPPAAAWQHQFGAEDIYKALRQYSVRLITSARLYKLSDQIVRNPGTVVPLSSADTETTLGELLLALNRQPAAAERFERALAQEPSSIRAALGKARAAGTDLRVSGPVKPSADWFTDYTIGASLLEHGNELDRASLDEARAALARAAAARGDLAHVQVLFAQANEQAQADPASVVEALRKAHAAAPARDDYTIHLAYALTRVGDFAGARGVLGELMAHPHLPQSGDMARTAMRAVALAEEYARRGQSPPAAAPADTSASAAPAEAPAARPWYRVIQAGEQRTEGLLERIDCSAKRIQFSVRVADRVVRFQVASFDAVEFISYRADLKGTMGCGPRTPPDPVYVTWRPGDLDGTAVAIEFLPKP